MPWTQEEKIFCVTINLAAKSFKAVQAKFHRKFNLTFIFKKAKFIVGYTNFKPQSQ